MSANTISEAMDEIAELFKQFWYPYAIAYPNQDFTVPAHTDRWARFTILHATGGQITLAGADGNSRFDRQGSVIIQTFTPLDAGVSGAYTAAEQAMRAFEGNRTQSGVWFRNTRMIEANDPSGLWYQINVITDFEYDQYR